jgi:hypothetical protein
VSKAKANEGVHPHAGRRSIAQSPVRRQRPRTIALSPDRHMARLQHYTSEQPQNACLINDRYGGVRTACTRSEKQRCASAKAITAHHRQAGRELFLGRLERECIQSARGKVSRSAATQHPISRRRAACSPAFRGIWWPFALTLLLVEAALSAQRRSRRACSLASHTAHALAPHSWLAAGWLSEGARAPTTCAARRCSAPLFTCIARAVPLAPLSAAVVLSRAVEPCCLLLVSSPSLP